MKKVMIGLIIALGVLIIGGTVFAIYNIRGPLIDHTDPNAPEKIESTEISHLGASGVIAKTYKQEKKYYSWTFSADLVEYEEDESGIQISVTPYYTINYQYSLQSDKNKSYTYKTYLLADYGAQLQKIVEDGKLIEMNGVWRSYQNLKGGQGGDFSVKYKSEEEIYAYQNYDVPFSYEFCEEIQEFMEEIMTEYRNVLEDEEGLAE